MNVSTQCPPGSFVYSVQAGDTLFRLAQTYNTTVNAIIAINPGINPNALQIGQRICIPGAAPVVCPGNSFPYVIRRGDTLFALAQQYGTTVAAIIAINPGINPNALQVGQTICIPGAAPPTCPTGSVPYVIRSGDTLFAIAQRFGTTVSAILAINPGLDPNALRIGQTICIPQAANTCPGGTFYTIQPGDTLFLIATRFDVSVNALQTANPGLDPTRLVPGQRICIPAAPPITCPGNNTYVIQAGENLSSIAERFTVSAADILVLNPGLRPSDFIPGRTICIPTTQAPV